jgi:rhodanese-related sulfurtransferase
MGGSSDGTPTGTPVATATTTPTAANDGYPEPSVIDETPPAPAVDPSAFETLRYEQGIEVPLVPVGIAYDWFRRREARFVDARGPDQYARSHVTGAVLSPASGRRNDPVTEWPTGDRIVCYCGCPHHLSTARAARLLANGYEEVYAIDEGFWEWSARSYPIAGENPDFHPSAYRSYVIEGETDPSHAGSFAWARTGNGRQEEATPIRADGSYELVLHFSEVTDSTEITVETPAYEVTAPLGELTGGRVTAEGRVAGEPQA